MRGEHTGTRGAIASSLGSSPRARGAPPEELLNRPVLGDHPRVRGEHIQGLINGLWSKGSSPRARGAHCPSLPGRPRSGIIPACAGSTSTSCARRRTAQDHPRVRGEHRPRQQQTASCHGSSPRARGALKCRAEDELWVRIIPACAGSTAARCSGACARRDHPRVRGEHPDEIAAWGSRLGSSPRARGALAAGENRSGGPGIIPACAGSTPTSSATMTAPRDHPRVRGEHSIRAVP